MSSDFTVIAIIAAFNEEDIIGQVVEDLIGQGVTVYLLDDGSTDATVAEALPFLGRGLLRIENFGDVGTGTPPRNDRFAWKRILERKTALAKELEANWFIHHDADEFRESPWAHLNLRDAIHTVDRLGYNAIDFELLDFWPTNGDFQPGDDVRKALSFYEFGQPWNKAQVRCWKKLDVPIDLASSGGHDVVFAGRRIFPLRFVLRHYPIRSQAHGERKIFRERRPRFDSEERERGWHLHYDGIEKGHSFLRDSTMLTRYDPDTIRIHLALRNRKVEELERTVNELGLALTARDADLEELRRTVESRDKELEDLRNEIEERRRNVDELRLALTGRDADLEQLRRALDSRNADVKHLQQRLAEHERDIADLRGALDTVRTEMQRLEAARRELSAGLDSIVATRSWRWTAPLRAIWRAFLRE